MTSLPAQHARPADDEAAADRGGTDDARYVLAVGREDEALVAAVAALSGPEGSPVRAVHAAGLTALVCDVPSQLYDEDGLRAQLEDLERLEAMARAHHTVVAGAYEHATVLPMRLATLYHDDARVARMLQERSAEFAALLSRLEGHLEWGVKVYADSGARSDRTGPADPSGPDDSAGTAPASDAAGSGGSPGRAYLRRRREQRRTHQDTYRAAGAVAERVAVLAAELATAKVSHRPQQGELAQGPGENIANDAYLVHGERAEEFRAAVGGAAQDVAGVHVELTGPWAPYSFATPPAEDGGTDGA